MDRTGCYQLLWQKWKDGVELLGVYGATSNVVLPAKLEELPLRKIGAYCFAEKSVEISGEISKTFIKDERMVEEQELDGELLRQVKGVYLEQIYLPDSVVEIGSLAFYNCTQLKEMKIGCDATAIGSDAFMNCKTFHKLKLRCKEKEKSGLRQILAQISTEMEVEFWEDEEKWAAVLFPEYTEIYDEIAPAHIFGRKIQGEGFRARQSFIEGVIDFYSYDKIFSKACVEEDEKTLEMMMWDRVTYPVALSKEAKEGYLTFLEQHKRSLGIWFVKEQRKADLRHLAERKCLTLADYVIIIQSAVEIEWAEGIALLMRLKQEYVLVDKKARYEFDEFR